MGVHGRLVAVLLASRYFDPVPAVNMDIFLNPHSSNPQLQAQEVCLARLFYCMLSKSLVLTTKQQIRIESVSGLSIDFLYLNVLGFACYSAWNIALLSSSSVRQEYRRRHDGHNPIVRGNDVAFAVHVHIDLLPPPKVLSRIDCC
jgi:hypothetical protein